MWTQTAVDLNAGFVAPATEMQEQMHVPEVSGQLVSRFSAGGSCRRKSSNGQFCIILSSLAVDVQWFMVCCWATTLRSAASGKLV